MGLDADSDLALSLVSDNTQRLTSAVNSLPQLMEKKRLIDMHTTIATGNISLQFLKDKINHASDIRNAHSILSLEFPKSNNRRADIRINSL